MTVFRGLRSLPPDLPQVAWPWQADIPCPGVTVAIGRVGEQELVPEFIGLWVSSGWPENPSRGMRFRPKGVVAWVYGADPERFEWTKESLEDGGFNLDMTRLIPTPAFGRDTMAEVGRALDMAEALAGPGAGAMPLVVIAPESGTSFREDEPAEAAEARLHETLSWLRPWAHARGVPVIYEVEIRRPGWTPAMSKALADRIIARGGPIRCSPRPPRRSARSWPISAGSTGRPLRSMPLGEPTRKRRRAAILARPASPCLAGDGRAGCVKCPI